MPCRPASRTRAARPAIVLAVLALTAAAPQLAHAQSARASFFLQMLRQNQDPRVRVSAALRLAELAEADTVPPLIQAFNAEQDGTVQAAIISTLAQLRDPRALPTVQSATRSPNAAVAAQARRALPILQAASAGGGAAPATNGGAPPGPAPSGGPARFLITVGSVNNQSHVGGSAMSQSAQSALVGSLQSNGQVVVHSGSAAAGQTTMRSRHLTGHTFDANIQSIEPRGNGVRVSVSIAVSTYPGRVYEFESQTAVTISGGSGDTAQVQADAVRRAIQSAAGRALQQLAQGQ